MNFLKSLLKIQLIVKLFQMEILNKILDLLKLYLRKQILMKMNKLSIITSLISKEKKKVLKI